MSPDEAPTLLAAWKKRLPRRSWKRWTRSRVRVEELLEFEEDTAGRLDDTDTSRWTKTPRDGHRRAARHEIAGSLNTLCLRRATAEGAVRSPGCSRRPGGPWHAQTRRSSSPVDERQDA